ncbi:MAG: phage tail protein, partial [Marmoricola sp.]
TPSVQFTLIGCLPVKLRAPSFNALNGMVAIEELTLVYDQLVVSAPGGAGGMSIGASIGVGASFSASASASASASFSAGASVGVGF